MSNVRSRFTLVKYDEPILNIKEDSEKKSEQGADATTSKHRVEQELRKFLDEILPPREFEENGHIWIQHVSCEPATRTDAVKLQEQLQRMMSKRKAQKSGICPIRRELFDQCFDELIRQVGIECPERGLLLLRVRDEWRMTLAIYEELCESSMCFGTRKAQQAEAVEADVDKVIEKLQKEHDELKGIVDDLTSKCNAMEKAANERRASQAKRQTEEIHYMKKLNQQLKNQLEVITSSKIRLEST